MRLIVFGCSFTDYAWPTWADIIAYDLGCKYENWAQGGGGNQQIARRALYRWSQGITPDDWIMIQWSGMNREDRFKDGRWILEGPVYMSKTYKKDFLEKYWDIDNDVINTAHSRITTELLFNANLKYQMTMNWEHIDPNNRIFNYWSKKLTQCDVVPIYNNPCNGKLKDGHPDPKFWLEWVEKKIYPKFNFTLKKRTIEVILDIQNFLEIQAELYEDNLKVNSLVYSYLQKEHKWPLTRNYLGDGNLM